MEGIVPKLGTPGCDSKWGAVDCWASVSFFVTLMGGEHETQKRTVGFKGPRQS